MYIIAIWGTENEFFSVSNFGDLEKIDEVGLPEIIVIVLEGKIVL